MTATSDRLHNLKTYKAMNPIEINIKVTIGMETPLLGMLARLMESRETAPEAVQAPKPTRPAKERPEKQPPTPEVNDPVPTQEPAPEAYTERQEQPSPEAAVAPATEQEPEATTEATADSGEKKYTVVDVRAAMDRLRKRIEGENYKEQPDSEGYQKWHKKLTGWFKNAAAICGADKPSELPDSYSRYKFIQLCENVRVENDELMDYCPF